MDNNKMDGQELRPMITYQVRTGWGISPSIVRAHEFVVDDERGVTFWFYKKTSDPAGYEHKIKVGYFPALVTVIATNWED